MDSYISETHGEMINSFSNSGGGNKSFESEFTYTSSDGTESKGYFHKSVQVKDNSPKVLFAGGDNPQTKQSLLKKADNYLNGSYHKRLPPKYIRIVVSFIAPVSAIDGAKSAWSGTDLYNRNISDPEQLIIAPADAIIPWLPNWAQDAPIFRTWNIYSNIRNTYNELMTDF